MGDWRTMDEQRRFAMGALRAGDLPDAPGVYALYREGERWYVGKAGSLRQRVWHNHNGTGAVMTGSAMRRNIAEYLGIATAADIKARRYQPTPAEIAAVRAWLEACEIAWLVCATEPEARALEDRLKAEDRPPLTRR